MNKQELKEQVSSLPSFKKVMVNKDSVLELIAQLDEPKKVVVPKFVADWYEKHKTALNADIFSAITGIYRKVNGENDDLLNTFEGWLTYEKDSILILSKIHRYGYEIEQEKPETLYTVEIPNPLLTNNTRYGQKTVLRKFKNGVLLTEVTGWDERKHYEIYHLTESEIRKDFEWAWQAGFAKEVGK